MSCWVAPAIAAEFWRISLDQVLAKMTAGSVSVRTENGFTFIDVLPDVHASPPPPAVAPPTYVVVSREELEALGAPPEVIERELDPHDDLEHTIAEEEFTPDSDGALPAFSWSSARTSAAQRRVAPARLAA